MAAYNALAFGCELRAHRLKLGWSAIQLSELYAEFRGERGFSAKPGVHLSYRKRHNNG